MAKLRTLLIVKEAQFNANPKPTLQRAYNALTECYKCFDELYYALSTDFVFDTAEEMQVKPRDFVGEDKIKIQKALRVLEQYRRGDFAPKKE